MPSFDRECAAPFLTGAAAFYSEPTMEHDATDDRSRRHLKAACLLKAQNLREITDSDDAKATRSRLRQVERLERLASSIKTVSWFPIRVYSFLNSVDHEAIHNALSEALEHPSQDAEWFVSSICGDAMSELDHLKER